MLNDIINYKKEDYLEAIKEYILLIKKSPDLVGVYQIGSIKNPGVSDIDLVIVLDDNSKEFSYKKYSIRNLSKKNQYLFMHEPFIINQSQLKNIRNLFPIFDLKQIYWNKGYNKIKIETMEDGLFEYFLISYLVRGYYDKRKINSLRLLLAVSSISKYSLKIIKAVTNKNPKTVLIKKSNYFLELKRDHLNINDKKINALLSEYNWLNSEIARSYLDFITENRNNHNKLHIDIKFLPKIIIYIPIKRYIKFSKLSIFPIQVFNNFYNKKFDKIRNRLYNYNYWIYKKRLHKFSMFTIQYSYIFFNYFLKYKRILEDSSLDI